MAHSMILHLTGALETHTPNCPPLSPIPVYSALALEAPLMDTSLPITSSLTTHWCRRGFRRRGDAHLPAISEAIE